MRSQHNQTLSVTSKDSIHKSASSQVMPQYTHGPMKTAGKVNKISGRFGRTNDGLQTSDRMSNREGPVDLSSVTPLSNPQVIQMESTGNFSRQDIDRPSIFSKKGGMSVKV